MKKILSLISLVAVMLVGGVMLGGCVNQKPQVAEVNTDIETVADQPEVVPAVEQPAEIKEVTDADLEAELKGLDAEMDTIKTTGFEQTDLSDKDLGL